MRKKFLLTAAAAAAVLLPMLAAVPATASPTAGIHAQATAASAALINNVSICDTGSAGLCLSDPGATTQGGTKLDMRVRKNVASQIIFSQSDNVYGCTFVGQGCNPFTLRKSLNTALYGDPIVELNFSEIGSNLCVGNDIGGPDVILSSCSVNRAAFVFVQKPPNGFELVNIYWSNQVDLSGGQALTGSNTVGNFAHDNQYVASSLQIWQP